MYVNFTRFGHSLVPDFIKAADTQDSLPLEGNFFNISVIQSKGSDTADMLKGLTQCPSEAFDGFVANTLTDKLYAEANSMGKFFGLDLVSLNIQVNIFLYSESTIMICTMLTYLFYNFFYLI
ncbi:unnamed protein product, partial [Meganyctiphanes norvegica]